MNVWTKDFNVLNIDTVFESVMRQLPDVERWEDTASIYISNGGIVVDQDTGKIGYLLVTFHVCYGEVEDLYLRECESLEEMNRELTGTGIH